MTTWMIEAVLISAIVTVAYSMFAAWRE